jgi:hypothetical protein
VDLPEKGEKIAHRLKSCCVVDTQSNLLAAKGNLFGLPAFLSEEDAALVLVRIERDRGDSDAKPLTFASALYYMRDWKIWEFSLYLLLNVREPCVQGRSSLMLTRLRTRHRMRGRTFYRSFLSKASDTRPPKLSCSLSRHMLLLHR